ncbi:response regulator transcription factor [Priestia megaterium]|jgi:DNA-binding response OmpR family regulator|uniref:response regulator transcription factor n=1 Tax=Priestia megaterium TaxID=1404 RepID=UPI00227ECBCF|nr:response regulator transcription factor [Priestia megaterium]MCY9017016.1 response regulator transcription factor [Priestia megaterium]MCY9023062.1 response regulator transcription factor [Priestia megaterium]MED3932192.1 response regulator transcription factor [Priestia megaterium]
MNYVLYIEDNEEIGLMIQNELKKQNYEVTWLQSGDIASQFIEQADIVILDVMLPGLDGFTVGKKLKKLAPDVPILMLSARTALEDKIMGLEFADDYVTKPFHPEELLARLEVLLRRFSRKKEELILKHLHISMRDYRVMNRETSEEISLTGKQFYIFTYFLQHLNQILTKEQIYEGVWKERYIEGDKTLMVHIRYLREKLEKNAAKPEIIETIRGIGYRVKQ